MSKLDPVVQPRLESPPVKIDWMEAQGWADNEYIAEVDPFNVVVISPTLRKHDKPEEVCTGKHVGHSHCPVIDTPDPSVVPLPAAVWLFATAIVALMGVQRMKR